MMIRYERLAMLAGAVLALGACSTGDARSDADAPANSAATTERATSPTGGQLTPDPGGKVITVEMETDAQGNNVFRPATIEARRGDVIRYVLVAGVHNAHFLPDSNEHKKGLPEEEPLLQLPGQTHDVKVLLEPGTYYFHCDPHALLGMIGHVTVVK